MESKFKLRLNNQKHSGFGIISTILGGLILVIVIALVVIILLYKELNDSTLFLIGVMGFLSLILSIIGLVLGIIGLTKKETLKSYSVIGTILTGILTGILTYFYFLGFIV